MSYTEAYPEQRCNFCDTALYVAEVEHPKFKGLKVNPSTGKVEVF